MSIYSLTERNQVDSANVFFTYKHRTRTEQKQITREVGWWE